MKTIGIISDTHGVVHPNIFKAFRDVDLIIHAGDIIGEDVLTKLGAISEVLAVSGNMDAGSLSKKLNEEIDMEVDGIKINISHKTEIPIKGYDIVIRGHTHKPEINSFGKTLFINPGSANKEKSLPIGNPSVAIVEIEKGKIDAKLIFV